MREARELQTHIDELVKHIAHLDKQLQDVVLAKPEMPTKIIGPNLEEILNAAGFYRGDAVCCNDYEKCIKPCTPKGRWLAEKELARPEHTFDTPESHIVKWSILVDPNNFGEPLAQFEQEPVAWLHPDKKVDVIAPTILGWFDKPVPLYTAPPRKEWVGLTDKERNEMIGKIQHDQFTRQRDLIGKTQIITEMYLKDRNT
jgi:hypothetical protein